jgi:hypothetical protein
VFDWLDDWEDGDDGDEFEPDVCDIEMGWDPFPD